MQATTDLKPRAISDLKLPHLALEEDWFAADPARYLAEARDQHPWLATSKIGYVVTNFPIIRELFIDESRIRGNYDEMVEVMGAIGTPWGDFQQGHILNASGITHRRLRDILAPAFTPREANRHRQLMRDAMAELLDEWAPKGTFDFEEFVSWFPVSVICRMVGTPLEAIPDLRSGLEALGLSVSMDKNLLPFMQDGARMLEVFSTDFIAKRTAAHKPGDDNDLLDMLIEMKKHGGITEAELINLLTFLLVAGYDTSKNVMTMMMWELIRNPEIYVRCAEDAAYCAKVVEEAMRYHSTNTMQRVVLKDITHRDVYIPTGTTLVFPWSIVARDPAAAENPELFQPERRNNAHMGFGLGAHMCLGQYIARAQMAEGLHLLAQRMKNPRSAGPAGWRPFPGVWGMKGLPIEFDPA